MNFSRIVSTNERLQDKLKPLVKPAIGCMSVRSVLQGSPVVILVCFHPGVYSEFPNEVTVVIEKEFHLVGGIKPEEGIDAASESVSYDRLAFKSTFSGEE